MISLPPNEQDSRDTPFDDHNNTVRPDFNDTMHGNGMGIRIAGYSI